jgi:hypothetical protein
MITRKYVLAPRYFKSNGEKGDMKNEQAISKPCDGYCDKENPKEGIQEAP